MNFDQIFHQYVLDWDDGAVRIAAGLKTKVQLIDWFIFSVEEVLGAEDKELNAWASLRKTCQYRGEEEERKDFHVYRNKVR